MPESRARVLLNQLSPGYRRVELRTWLVVRCSYRAGHSRLSAYGPMTAIVLQVLLSGNVLFWFLSSTIDSREALSESSRWAGEAFSENEMRRVRNHLGRIEHTELEARRHKRFTATSMSASLISPSFTAWTSDCIFTTAGQIGSSLYGRAPMLHPQF